jgi:hypothetical protein
MGVLSRFGAGKTAEKRRVQKAREGMAVSEETVVKYRAARAFLLGEWFGASLMVASFSLLYLFGIPGGPPVPIALGVCLSIFLFGTYVFWTSHRYYVRLGFPWAKRWDTTAIVMAGAGAIFWLLFALLEVLVYFGVPIR